VRATTGTLPHHGYGQQQSDGVKRPPLHTTEEIAQHLGITARQLNGALHVDDAPKPVRRLMGNSARASKRRTYYVLKDVVAWYRRTHPKAA
jgi:hypothetical protein